jgi:hypothetical protein
MAHSQCTGRSILSVTRTVLRRMHLPSHTQSCRSPLLLELLAPEHHFMESELRLVQGALWFAGFLISLLVLP